MSSVIPTPEFKFGDAESESPSTVQKVAKVDAYVVSYKDGAGKDQARIVFRVPGADVTFMINERISGSHVVTSAHPWFHKALVEKLRVAGMERTVSSESVESV